MERLMQYVWQHRLWPCVRLRTTDGEPVDVLDPGLLNNDAGPDFFNAKIRIGGRTWAGNVEIHQRASDWFRHGHHNDPAYDSVILHVVGCADVVVKRSDGHAVPQLEMPCAPDFRERYSALVDSPLSGLACASGIPAVDRIYLSDWINSLLFERLQTKAVRVYELASAAGGDWGHAVYVTLARALGFSINSEPFERLALSLPLRTLRKHADSQVTVEGLIFGMAGFLDDDVFASCTPDVYMLRMKAEYRFMSAKFGLSAPRSLGWKMARMRPWNFPHRRLATLASFICQGFRPGYELLSVRGVDDARALFDIELHGYWARRFQFGPETARSARAFSESSLNTILINVAAPVLYSFGCAYGREDMTECAVGILQSLPAEQNSIVRLFTEAGVECRDAFTSQALIGLRRNYCNQRKCLYCRLGHRLLAARAMPQGVI